MRGVLYFLTHVRVSVLPFVEGCVLGVALQRAFLNDESHLLEERGGGGGGLPLEQDVYRLVHGGAKLTPLAVTAFAALGVLTVSQSV